MTNHRAAKFVAILGCSVFLASCARSIEPQSRSTAKRSTTSSSTSTTTTTQPRMVNGVSYDTAKEWIDRTVTEISSLRRGISDFDSINNDARGQTGVYRSAVCISHAGMTEYDLSNIRFSVTSAPWEDLGASISNAISAVENLYAATCGIPYTSSFSQNRYDSLRGTAEASIAAAESLLGQYANAASVTTTTLSTTTTTAPAVVDRPSSSARMPNVLCLSLQQAQDAIQSAGVFFSRSVDASGQGRSQLIDSNWQVVAQDPAPGVVIGEGTARLSAVKYGEPSPC